MVFTLYNANISNIYYYHSKYLNIFFVHKIKKNKVNSLILINNSYFELKKGKYFGLKTHLCNVSSRDIHFAETCLTITSSLAQLARQDAGIQNRDDAARKIRSIFRTGLLAGQDLCSIYGCPANPTVS